MAALLTDTLKVPDEYAATLPCVLRGDLFTDDRLDYDYFDDDWRALPLEEQRAHLQAKQVVEALCVAECAKCPIIDQCREWAKSTRVHGVAGGLTEEQRHGYRRNAAPAAPATTSRRASRTPVDMERLSPETRAMYEYLAAAGVPCRRDDVIAAAMEHVDDETALHWGRYAKGDEDKQRAAGRRKFLLNRLDIATRRGRISTTKADGAIMVSLARSTVEAQPAA